MMSHSESSQSASRRFVDLIGESRLERGAMKIERGRCNPPEAYYVGKEAFIMATLFPQEVCWCPYLPGSNQASSYQSGARIECADLTDVVLRCQP